MKSVLLLLLCLLLPASARAGFLDDAASRSEGILRLAELGLARSRDPDLTVLARRLLDEHGRSLTDLRLVARQRGIGLTVVPPRDTMAALDRLAGLPGDAVAAAVRQQIRHEHDRLAEACRDQVATGSDLQLVMMAEQLLARLQRRQIQADQTDMR